MADQDLDSYIKHNDVRYPGRGRGGAARGRGGGSRAAPRGRGGSFTRGRGGVVKQYVRPSAIPTKWGGGGSSASAGGGRGGPAKIQISNLDFGVTEDDILELFSEFGSMRVARVNFDASGRSHGTAEVQYNRYDDATKAAATYQGVPLDGRPMKIEIVGGQYRDPGSSGRSRGRGRVRGGSRGGKRQEPPSKEDLDAELDSFKSNTA